MKAEEVLKPKFRLEKIEVSGEPYERGYSYGEIIREKISRFLKEEYYETTVPLGQLVKTEEASKEQMLKFAKRYTPYIEDYSPEIYEEMRGIAEGSGKTLEEIVLKSMHEERDIFGEKEFKQHCKVVAATETATVDRETYIGQTWDVRYIKFWEGAKSILLHEKRKTGPDILAYTYPGLLAGAGINSEGISLSWTSTPRVSYVIGVPTYVIIAEILRKKSIVEALQAILNAKRAGFFKFTIADKYGEIYVIEATPKHHNLIYVDDLYGYSSNFISEEIINEFPPSKRDGVRDGWIARGNRVKKLLKRVNGKIDLNALYNILSDHPLICVHPDFTEGKFTGGITMVSWVMVPSKREWWITHGPPCQNELIKYTV